MAIEDITYSANGFYAECNMKNSYTYDLSYANSTNLSGITVSVDVGILSNIGLSAKVKNEYCMMTKDDAKSKSLSKSSKFTADYFFYGLLPNDSIDIELAEDDVGQNPNNKNSFDIIAKSNIEFLSNCSTFSNILPKIIEGAQMTAQLAAVLGSTFAIIDTVNNNFFPNSISMYAASLINGVLLAKGIVKKFKKSTNPFDELYNTEREALSEIGITTMTDGNIIMEYGNEFLAESNQDSKIIVKDTGITINNKSKIYIRSYTNDLNEIKVELSNNHAILEIGDQKITVNEDGIEFLASNNYISLGGAGASFGDTMVVTSDVLTLPNAEISDQRISIAS